MEVVVEYEYEANHDDELSLKLGEVIKNVRYIQDEDGWMEGELNGKRGVFPDNFVKEVKKDIKEVKETKHEPKEDSSLLQRREKSAGNVANLVQRMSSIGIPTGGFQLPPPAPAKKPKKRLCKVLFDYTPHNEDELGLTVGEVVEVNQEVEEGWWSGTLNGKTGLFPSNFVKEIEPATEEAESVDAAADEMDGTALDNVPSPTTPQASLGNGVIPKKIRGIGFGDIFKEGSVKLKARLPSPETEERKEKPIPSLPSAAKPSLPNMTDSHRADGDKSKAKELCKVTFAFDTTNEDELRLKEGDIITILSKDTGEPGWWRGEVGGKKGVFPDNFVTLLSEGEKETLPSRSSLKSSPRQESEEKPKKPLLPSKSIALKPEVPSAEKKPHHIRLEDRVDKPTLEYKPSKPVAPLVPPKKPVPPPAKGKPGGLPPKRPDKPIAPSPSQRLNGEVPSLRPKSEFEPLPPSRPKTLSGDWGDKSSDMSTDLMSFDDLSSTSEKLSHPTVNRPKMPGRRLPAQFAGGHSPNKEVSVEKSFKLDDDINGAKVKLPETRKPSTSLLSPSSSFHRASLETKTNPAAPISSTDGGAHRKEDAAAQLEELRSQMKELVMSVELLKTQQMKEIADLRGELDDEKLKRMTLQMELERLKRMVHST